MNLKLKTNRLELEPFTTDDSKVFHAINTNPFVRRYIWDDDVISVELADGVLQQNQDHFISDGFGIWKIKRKGEEEIMGYVGLWFFFEEPQPQLIYALLEPYTKNGYAKEAAEAIISYAFDQLNYNYLIAATDEPHHTSQKVAESLGMIFSEKRIENEKPTLFYRIEKPNQY